jgi:8-oxo-dGTP pyrophosphatase MutT (NUDIX family)
MNPSPVPPRLAASVILVRQRHDTGEVEVFLQRRHRKASFMSSAFVFPGGAADPHEHDLRITAARELFEEAGVLLTRSPIDAALRTRWRDQLNAGQRSLDALLAEHPESPPAIDIDALHYYAHWITPSIEKKRFSAKFYIALLPEDQSPSLDNKEAVEQVWVTPTEALANAGELRLPPPQVRTFMDMQPAASEGIDALLDSARQRASHAHAIMPRMAPMDKGFALLLPWDPEYHSKGTGDLLAMPIDHPLAVGPSRFVLEDMSWNHIDAPSSPRGE